MQNKEIKKLNLPDGVTYVNGLGFIQTDNSLTHLVSIRRHSTIICFSMLAYFLCKRLFMLPATNFAHFLGFEVSINQFTGMIITSQLSKMVIYFFVNCASMFVALSIVCAFAVRDFRMSSTFSRPAYGVTSIALPIIVASGIVGEFLGRIFLDVSSIFGVIFPKPMLVSASKDVFASITVLTIALLVTAFEEILFRGAILFTLRRFNDGFAIIISSLVFALFRENAVDMIWAFFLGLVLGYFTIRANSLIIPLVGRLTITVITFAVSVIRVYISGDIATVTINLIYLLVLICAACAYISFIRRDPSAFTLKSGNLTLSLRRKIASFCCTIAFIGLAAIISMSVVNSIQIIG